MAKLRNSLSKSGIQASFAPNADAYKDKPKHPKQRPASGLPRLKQAASQRYSRPLSTKLPTMDNRSEVVKDSDLEIQEDT
jgi:hypothetical protein